MLRSSCVVKLGDVKFVGSLDFPPGMLPLQIHIVQEMISLLRERSKGFTQKTAAKRIAINLIDQWIHCNVYTKADRHVEAQILKVYKEYTDLYAIQIDRRNDSWKTKVGNFHKRASTTLFDIFMPDPRRLKCQEIFWGVKMSQD